MQAAIGHFARRMHYDVIDALDRAIVEGWTDRDRVAIYGSSYGGYAASRSWSNASRLVPAAESSRT